MIMNTVKRHSIHIKSEDFFETQDSTIDILYNHYLKNNKDFKKSFVMDFCCGKGAILNRLSELELKIKVYGSDIVKRGEHEINHMFNVENLMKSTSTHKYNVHIVMNPPFNQLTKTLDYYLNLMNKYKHIKSLSLLHSLRSLEGQERYKILQKYGFPNIILNMTKRQSFNTYYENEKREWTPPFSCVWSIWNNLEEKNNTKFIYV